MAWRKVVLSTKFYMLQCAKWNGKCGSYHCDSSNRHHPPVLICVDGLGLLLRLCVLHSLRCNMRFEMHFSYFFSLTHWLRTSLCCPPFVATVGCFCPISLQLRIVAQRIESWWMCSVFRGRLTQAKPGLKNHSTRPYTYTAVIRCSGIWAATWITGRTRNLFKFHG